MLSSDEQERFEAIARQLAEDDPRLVRAGRRSGVGAAVVGQLRAGAGGVVTGVVALVVAVHTGVYLLGLAGYLAASLAAASWWQRRTVQAHPADRRADAGGRRAPKVAAGVAVTLLVVLVLLPGGGSRVPSSDAPADRVPVTAPYQQPSPSARGCAYRPDLPGCAGTTARRVPPSADAG